MPYFKRKRGKRITRGKQFSMVENENTATEAGLLEPMLLDSRMFQHSILPVLQNSYMYTESGNCFRYSDAHMVNSATLEEEYRAFRVEKKKRGYTKEELEESFGFLLFDEEEEAKKMCESGLQVGHSTCSTLGDPSKDFDNKFAHQKNCRAVMESNTDLLRLSSSRSCWNIGRRVPSICTGHWRPSVHHAS
ncbi:hypothetical protein AAFF_G00172600 [Aldrovandia affinis]|uniref:TASOR pseudo-PARP domain-containing protein n=1 Tax=Aldrovandia affinis TaxID=143900 RepID=A0AAD7WWW3_9TELE|nr:hypothetical protein AAFF_G00172600 [Aldrovandia affinis]